MVVISYMVILCSSLVFQVFLFHALTTLFTPIVFSHNFIFCKNRKNKQISRNNAENVIFSYFSTSQYSERPFTMRCLKLNL